MSNLSTQLADARPTDADLDALWSPADRSARLTALMATERRRRRTRRATLPAAVAAVATVVLVAPMLDSGDAAAADLHALAHSAVTYDGPVLAQGSWLHETGTSVQHDKAMDGHPAALYAHTVELWTSWDGRLLIIDDETSEHATEYDVIDDHVKPSYQDPTPAFSATLPETAEGLLAYLDPKVFGSSSHAEAMYSALIQLAGSHTLPPVTLAAAFDALATIDHVSTDDVEVDGRAAVEVSYDEQLTHSTEAYVFDRATGQELSTHDHSRQGDDVSTTTLSEVLDEVPADVRADFAAHQDGGRYDDATGAPVPD